WQAPCINNTFQGWSAPVTANLTIPEWARDHPSGRAIFHSAINWHSSWTQELHGVRRRLAIRRTLTVPTVVQTCPMDQALGWYRDTATYYEFRKYHVTAHDEQPIEAHHTRLIGSGGQFFPLKPLNMPTIPLSNTVPNPAPTSRHDSYSQSASRSIYTGDDGTRMKDHDFIHVTSPASPSYGQAWQFTSTDVGNAGSAQPYLPSSDDQQTVEERHGLESSRKSDKDA
ncbi:2833_t:CDS:2, partial [Acaulospora colombiana]